MDKHEINDGDIVFDFTKPGWRIVRTVLGSIFSAFALLAGMMLLFFFAVALGG